MKIEKQFDVAATQDDVWALINDPARIGPCIPGCQEVADLGDNKYRAAIKVQAGPIKTTFHVNVEATSLVPPSSAEFKTTGDEGGKASRLQATSKLDVTKLDNATCRVTYASDITLSGRFGKFGAGIMHKIADRMNDEFVAALQEALRADRER